MCQQYIGGSFWKPDQRRCRFPDEMKTNLKQNFVTTLYFRWNVFGEIRVMTQFVNASLFLVQWVFFGTNKIFMAVICDMAKK